MDSLIFGSTAVRHWFPDFKRNPSDLDVISSTIKKHSKEGDYHWAEGFKYVLENNKDEKYVDPNFLYTIKVSHAAWDVKWDKTMHDIGYLQSKKCILDNALYALLIKDWEVIHHKKRIILKGPAEEFFNKNIKRAFNHDDVHEIVKFYDKPMHTRIRKDLSDVKCSRDLWDALSNEDKLKCCLEEIYVFALERYVEFPPKIAFIKALKQLITKSTKGYFNLFLIERFFDLLYYDRSQYLEFFKQYKGKLNG